jgi:hypothetical protein
LQQGSRSQQQQLANTNAVAAKAIIELKKPAFFFIITLLCLVFVCLKVFDFSNICFFCLVALAISFSDARLKLPFDKKGFIYLRYELSNNFSSRILPLHEDFFCKNTQVINN